MTDVATITPRAKQIGRHSWSDPVRFQYKTERTCLHCGIVKVTRHEPDTLPWLEFYRGLEKIECDRTPKCEASS